MGAPQTRAAAADDAELAARFRVALMRLHRRLRQEHPGGFSPAQVSALASIDRLGGPTLGALADAEQIQPPTVTRLVASLEAAGLVVRRGEPHDRRVVRVELSDTGRSTLQRIRTQKNAYLVDRLALLDPDERQGIDALVRLLERMVGQ